MRTTRRVPWSVVVLAALAILLGAPGCKPGWSSDGKSVAFWYTPEENGPSFLATCDIATGAVKRVFVSRQHELLRPAYAPDDKSLLVLAARKSSAKGSQDICDMDVLRIRLDPKSKGPTQAYEKLATIKAIQTEPLMDYDLIVDGQGQLWWTWYEKPDKKAGRSERNLPLRIDPATGAVSRPFKDRNVRLLRGPAGILGVEGIWKKKRVGILRLAKQGPVLEYLAGAAGTLGEDRLLAVGKRHLAASPEIRLQKTKGVRLELLITELTGKVTARIQVPGSRNRVKVHHYLGRTVPGDDTTPTGYALPWRRRSISAPWRPGLSSRQSHGPHRSQLRCTFTRFGTPGLAGDKGQGQASDSR